MSANLEHFFGHPPSLDDVRQLFAHHEGRPELKPLARPCRKRGEADCAVVCGLYGIFSEALSTLPADEVRQISNSWYCHNHANRACAGNIAYQRARTSWDRCEHEWRGTDGGNDRSDDVICKKCGCPGERDRATGDVFWPAT